MYVFAGRACRSRRALARQGDDTLEACVVTQQGARSLGEPLAGESGQGAGRVGCRFEEDAGAGLEPLRKHAEETAINGKTVRSAVERESRLK
jgi:hypothetical protein